MDDAFHTCDDWCCDDRAALRACSVRCVSLSRYLHAGSVSQFRAGAVDASALLRLTSDCLCYSIVLFVERCVDSAGYVAATKDIGVQFTVRLLPNTQGQVSPSRAVRSGPQGHRYEVTLASHKVRNHEDETQR